MVGEEEVTTRDVVLSENDENDDESGVEDELDSGGAESELVVDEGDVMAKMGWI